MKKNKKNKQQINYLDLIPVRPEKLGWHIDRRERVVLEVKNEGFFNRIAQTYFRRPQTTKVHLDIPSSEHTITSAKQAYEVATLFFLMRQTHRYDTPSVTRNKSPCYQCGRHAEYCKCMQETGL